MAFIIYKVIVLQKWIVKLNYTIKRDFLVILQLHKSYLYQFRAPYLADGAWNNMIYGFADVLAPDWLIPGLRSAGGITLHFTRVTPFYAP